MIEVKKKEGESSSGLLFRFSKKVRQSGVLKEVRKRKMLAHIGNMMGAYIATVTAFVVVNINFVKPGWIVWLLPTALGLPVIMCYTRVWKKKLKLD